MQLALYRYTVIGELHDDDIVDFFYNDITELEAEDREKITFEEWPLRCFSTGFSPHRGNLVFAGRGVAYRQMSAN
jgi:hypothetical protein